MHRRIGYCPENPYFYDYLTARELMEYFGELFGFDAATRRHKCDELLTAVGLEEKTGNANYANIPRECCNASAWPNR
ncbi:MAG: hypothetical protein IPP63_03285 [Chloracidobacterium sp.]|nr:hypothetical protein [Chloracidobacterium sp.]